MLRVFARDEGLDGGVALDDPRQQRTLIHVIKTRRQLEGSREVLDHFKVSRADQFDQQILVIEDVITQAVGLLLIELVPLHRREHRAEHLGPRISANESERSLASQRSSSLLALCWLISRAM